MGKPDPFGKDIFADEIALVTGGVDLPMTQAQREELLRYSPPTDDSEVLQNREQIARGLVTGGDRPRVPRSRRRWRGRR